MDDHILMAVEVLPSLYPKGRKTKTMRGGLVANKVLKPKEQERGKQAAVLFEGVFLEWDLQHLLS